jgi:hypothetical protein
VVILFRFIFSNIGRTNSLSLSDLYSAGQLNATEAERAAVGNLAFLLLAEERYEEDCRPFLQRFTALCCALNDQKGQADGHMALGT